MEPTHIREWREQRGFSLREVARRIEADGNSLSHATINRIETGAQPYNQTTLEAIARALGLPVLSLLAGPPGSAMGEAVTLLATMPPDAQAEAVQFLRFRTQNSA